MYRQDGRAAREIDVRRYGLGAVCVTKLVVISDTRTALPFITTTHSHTHALTCMVAQERAKFADLALKIFMNNPPVDVAGSSVRDYLAWQDRIEEQGSNIATQICIVTGKPITDSRYWECSVCRHKAYEHELRAFKNCPLCHATIHW